MCFDNLPDRGSSFACILSEEEHCPPTGRIKIPRDNYGNSHTFLLLLTQGLLPNPHQIIIGQRMLLKPVDDLVQHGRRDVPQLDQGQAGHVGHHLSGCVDEAGLGDARLDQTLGLVGER